MKHIFIINPTAGQGKSLEFIRPRLDEVCKKYSLDCEIIITQRQGEGIEIVREKAKSGEEIRFYACGGDGKEKVFQCSNAYCRILQGDRSSIGKLVFIT